MIRKLMVYGLCLLLAACSMLPAAQRSPESKGIPVFDHIFWIVLENRNYDEVIGNKAMPYLNDLIQKNVLLSRYYAIRHPSLPNYLALVGGSTFQITKDCVDCVVDAENLADRLESAGLTWKTYQADMPSPCYIGNHGLYRQKHNPFVYFQSIRSETQKCEEHVVGLDALYRDITAKTLPNFALIVPNMCYIGHDCGDDDVDEWLQQNVPLLQSALAGSDRWMVAITYDEARTADKHGCCGLGLRAGGHIATVLISPLAKAGFVDDTRLTHYSLLKTALDSWHLPDLGVTERRQVLPITAPWLADGD